MIQRNDLKESENENKKAVRTFTKILHIAEHYWGEFFYDLEKKLARGVMTSRNCNVYTAELSYNVIKNRLSLIVRLKIRRQLTPNESEAVLRFQYHTAGLLSFLTVDRESLIANVRAHAAIAESQPECAVDSIFTDTYTLLEDDNVHQLVN